MDTETHPDPFQDAMSHGLHRAIQVASCAVTAAQVYAHQKRTQASAVAERDERARRALAAQIRAGRDAARAGWAPVLDPGWLRQAGLLEVTRAWGAAMPYADRAAPWYEPAAATAMRKCEERLRVLHPDAMARYDQLRGDGTGPADAMREAAPMFAAPPRAQDAPNAPWPEPGLATITSPRADTAAAPRADRTSQPWERDFPMPIGDVVATASRAALPAAPSPAAAPAPARHPRQQP